MRTTVAWFDGKQPLKLASSPSIVKYNRLTVRYFLWRARFGEVINYVDSRKDCSLLSTAGWGEYTDEIRLQSKCYYYLISPEIVAVITALLPLLVARKQRCLIDLNALSTTIEHVVTTTEFLLVLLKHQRI